MLLGLCLLAPALARAEGEPSEPFVDIHGFVSGGAIRTTANNYLAKDTVHGSLEFSEVGINFTKALGDDFRVGIQLFARDLGPIGDYKPQADWYYLDYHPTDWFGVRVGRLKLPLGLYNETSDIDSARVPVLLPQSIYSTQSRDYFLAQTGAELYGYQPIGDAGALDYRAYAGTIFIDLGGYTAIGTTGVSIPYLYGGRLMWHTPLQGFQLGASAQRLRLDVDYLPNRDVLATFPMPLPAGFDGTVRLQAPVTILIASAELTADNLLLAAEYLREWARVKSSLPEQYPESNTVSEGLYVMASYQVATWFTPGAYYSLSFPNVEDRHGRDAYQHDVALSFRYDLNQHWLLKLEGHYMIGTAGLDPALNGGTPRDQLSRDWGAFFAKTTAYF